MKRKRKDSCPSPLLDDSPKRTKVHAQRKFAQGSNVNSPVITPVQEIEKQEVPLPEPVELLPMKRPNTEDFLTFLCFRGTPMLPPNLNFFNTASIVDTNGQVHEIKSESPKNGPIDTSALSKSGSGSSDRPFVAFGVRKRADPIVISRQMDKKRRHALTLQALRRKYQEQKMAKIRAVTISKLSEKVSHRSLVRSNSVTKSDSGKKNPVQKSNKVSENLKGINNASVKNLRPQIKQKMCLRSFRGRFVQRELQFRTVKKTVISKRITKKDESLSSSEDEKSKAPKLDETKVTKKIAPPTTPKKPEISSRITRSNKFLNNKITSRRQQIKLQLLMTSPKTTVKPRTLRSNSNLKVLTSPKAKQTLFKLKTMRKPTKEMPKKETVETSKKLDIVKKEIKSETEPRTTRSTADLKNLEKREVPVKKKIEVKKESKPQISMKKPVVKVIKKPESSSEKEMKKVIVKKVKEQKKEVPPKKEEVKEELAIEPPITSQRPTRKTKEAAAIYMEILSHKLVSESKTDDDNVSIDSFPELPNVKKTEQRENELKAKAQSSKEDAQNDTKKRSVETRNSKMRDEKKIDKHEKVEDETKPKKDETVKKPVKKNEEKRDKNNEEQTKKEEVVRVKQDVASTETLKKEDKDRNDDKVANVKVDESKGLNLKQEKPSQVELKVQISPLKADLKKTDVELKVKNTTVPDLKVEKSVVLEVQKSRIDEVKVENSEPKLKKPEEIEHTPKKAEKIGEGEITRRLTRNSSQNIRHVETDDSDESFRIDVRIPRKKLFTRSKSRCHNSDSDDSRKKSLRRNARSYKECDSSELEFSSDFEEVKVSVSKSVKPVQQLEPTEQSFSDSDEEPLSKLTKPKNSESDIKKQEEKIQDKVEEGFSKPKRECTKRQQYYLPLFSSSDEEEYFQPSKAKPVAAKAKNPVNIPQVQPTSDLSYKDVDRRFGKGKVNMSNEQIEKWLKESAMAGSSVKKENDSMLKFGEKIPTETSRPLAQSIDTEKLKELLIGQPSEEKPVEQKPECSGKSEKQPVKPVIDRKLIFRNKAKVPATPNVSAFSVSNESSVYAFGEETEHVMKTPFRRPSRRPSSTATSRSEDELSKAEDSGKIAQFRKPTLIKQDSFKSSKEETAEEITPPKFQKVEPSTSMVPPSNIFQKARDTKTFLRATSEEFKYKVPSSPSASSSSSAKLYNRRPNTKVQIKATEVIPVRLPEFPKNSAQLVEALTFYPTEKEFQDPLEFIEKIRGRAEQFGICRIVPPSTFKPECKVTDDMRFTAYNQYVHKLLHRWGPNFKELMAVKKYLSTQNITLTHPPWIGGMEIDLPRLYQTVQSLGGLKEVIEKKKWPRVSDAMKIPKSAQDRVTKLDDIYCKYLLPYDTLSPAEREKLFDEVETEWAKRESKSLLKAQQGLNDEENEEDSESDDEAEECIVKGRNMALNAFYRIARNTMSMWFKTPEATAEEVEQEFWKHVTLKQNHICVHSGSIDSGSWGYGFAVSKNSPFARHAWNLKVLTNNSGSVLRALGPIMGVTVPTLHVGMVFSSCCWYRDPHSLPWIEYLHTGGSKIWYGIPDSTSEAFQTTLKRLVPNYCRNKSLWLPSDTVMVPPSLLVENGVSLSRIVQEPGQFIVVFPKVFTSSLSTGYVVSESVYFAPSYWLRTARAVFDNLRNSCEQSMFSLDRLLLSIVSDARSSVEVLRRIVPAVKELCDKELVMRDKIKRLGVSEFEKLPLPEAPNVRKKKKLRNDDGEYECDICRMNLFISMINEPQEDGIYCLEHALEEIEKEKISVKNCKLMYTYDDDELRGLEEKIKTAIDVKLHKKLPNLNKFADMPTLLKS